MKDGPLTEKYRVTKRGTPDPPGARYFVLDYVNDPHARIPARGYAATLRTEGKVAMADALVRSLEGEPEEPVLRSYEIERLTGEEKSGARYIALNYVHEYPARVAVRMYITRCRETHPELAADLSRVLVETMGEHEAHMVSKHPQTKKRRGRRR